MRDHRVNGIEVIIWAATGVKRCTDFRRSITKDAARLLDAIGLVCKDGVLKTADWPSWSRFSRKYRQTGDDNSGNLATGMGYDIPYCCAKKFHDENIKFSRALLQDHPFRGAKSGSEFMKLYAASAKNQKAQRAFWSALNKHFRRYSKGRRNRVDGVWRMVKRMLRNGSLPKYIYFLTGHTYIPCKLRCRKFVGMAKRMFDSLVACLGEREAKKILRRYEAATHAHAKK